MGTLQHPPELLRHETWPTVDMQQLDGADLLRFHTYKAAIEAACRGEKSGYISKRFGISRSNLSYLLGRCVDRHPDGRLWGFRALVKHARHVPYRRTEVASVAADSDGYGLVGAFEQMLVQHPNVVRVVRREIKGVGKIHAREGGLNLAALHSKILDQLREDGVGLGDYPFNTKSGGYRSLVRHINRLMAEGDNEIARHRYGESALDGLQAGTGERGLLQPVRALDMVAYDEQKLPFFGTLVIEIEGKEVNVPLSRGHLCVLVCSDSKCILGYAVTVQDRIKALQLLTAYESFLTPWQPKKLTIPKLHYKEGAGLPSGVVPECPGHLINILSVDNHLSHLAESVVGNLRQQTGTRMRYGKVRHWIARSVVEGLFAELQKHSFIRIPSTTGSGPDDPAVTQPTKRAVDLRIRMDQLLEFLDVVVANYNATAKRSLMSKTPLEVLAASLSGSSRLSILPKVSEAFLMDPKLAIEIITSTVRGSKAKGKRPYIQIDYGHYTNDILAQSWDMVGKKLKVHIRGDFRSVRAFREDGTEFGVLMVTGHWATSFHTREMRKETNHLHDAKVIDKWKGDPVKALMEHLAHTALKKSAKTPYKVNKEGSKLASMAHAQNPDEIRYVAEDSNKPTQRHPPEVKPRGRRSFFSNNKDGAP